MIDNLGGYERFYGPYTPATSDLNIADLHSHTNLTDGLLKPEQVVDKAVKVGLTAIAVTDHGTIESALIARDYALRNHLPIEVVVGGEFNAKRLAFFGAHIIGLFLKNDIPENQSIEYTIDQIRHQGGVPIIAHPFHGLTFSVGMMRLRSLVKNPNVDIGGIEIYGSRTSFFWNEVAKRFYLRYSSSLGAPIGGSDGHTPNSIGTTVTAYRGDLRTALEEARTGVLYLPKNERISIRDYLRVGYNGFVKEVRRKVEANHS